MSVENVNLMLTVYLYVQKNPRSPIYPLFRPVLASQICNIHVTQQWVEAVNAPTHDYYDDTFVNRVYCHSLHHFHHPPTK